MKVNLSARDLSPGIMVFFPQVRTHSDRSMVMVMISSPVTLYRAFAIFIPKFPYL